MFAIESLLRCPKCHARPLVLDPAPRCTKCGIVARSSGGIADFVHDEGLSDRNLAELEAQRNAVDEYYENEDKLSCHWDRISANDVPDILNGRAGLVLDLGCGTGGAGGALHDRGATVIGADLSIACLQRAKERLDGVVRTPANALPFADETFDAVISRGALHHIDEPHAALSEARRVLKRGGTALFIDPRDFAWLEPIKKWLRRRDDSFTDDHHGYRLDEYRRLIGQHFELEKVEQMHPFFILWAVGLDLVPLPSLVPRRALAERLFSLEQALNKTPLSAAGHLIAVKARRLS